MGRKSTVHLYLNKIIGGIKIIRPLGLKNGRMYVECLCLKCNKAFEATFHHVYKGKYKSCGCIQYGFKEDSNRWKGFKEISRSYFNSLRRGAKSRNLDFLISIEDIWDLFLKQNKKCAYSNEELKFPDAKIDVSKTASLDRIDSSKGYTLDNIRWVHKDINYMKQDFTHEEFLNWVTKIYNNHYEK